MMHATRTRILLAAVGLAAALLASGCDTGQQVPWASYDSALQPRIDAATATTRAMSPQSQTEYRSTSDL